MIQHLLREARSEGIDEELVSVTAEGLEAQADWTNLGSPETYLGYQQGQNLDSPGGVAYDEPRSYVAPESLQLNTWALGGNWTIEERASVLNEAGGRIAFRFHARDVHLVLRSRAGTVVPFRVLVDGEAPGAAHGLDVDERGPGNAARATALSAGARARVDHGPHVRDRIPRCRRRGVRLHLRLATGSAFSGAGTRSFHVTVSTSADSASPRLGTSPRRVASQSSVSGTVRRPGARAWPAKRGRARRHS